MNWQSVAILGTIVITALTLFLAVQSNFNTRFTALETRMDTRIGRLEMLLTENLVQLNRETATLIAKSHTHKK